MRNFKSAYKKFICHYQEEDVKRSYLFCNLLLPFIIVLLCETMTSHSLLGGFHFILYHPVSYLANVSMVFASLTLSLLFFRRLGAIILISFFWILLAFIDFMVLFFRVTPFTGSDLLLLKDGFDVVSKYLGPIQILLILIAVILAAIGVSYFIFITPKCSKLLQFTKIIPAILGSFILSWLIICAGQKIGLLETQFHELSASYRNNGFYYCFIESILNVGISKPDDYSTEAIEQLAEETEEIDPDAVYYSRKPNIVIVQLESFFNVNRLNTVTFTENPLPNLTEIMEKNPSGFLDVPVIGAGTVNSEFEMLTGMNIDDFGIGEYPYKTILKSQPCESLAYNLSSYGYTAFAIHNNTGDFYERNQVYRNLGFNYFDSVEYMWPTGYTPMDWSTDDVLVTEIRTALDSTPEQDFVFTVSVQGHGSYPGNTDLEYEKYVDIVRTSITDEEYLNQLTYYVNQLYEMDQFIGKLLTMLRNRREPTVLVMYGDHLPSLDIQEDNLKTGTLYQTEYFIWNNSGLQFEGGEREAFMISSEILGQLGITDGAINSYHQKNYSVFTTRDESYDIYLNGLKELEYDILYGDNIYYNGVNPFEATELTMGIRPISISDVSCTKDHVLIVTGENFTRYSKIYVNDSEYTTLYLDPQTLVAADVSVNEGDIVSVSQSGLSISDPYTYHP